MEQSPTKIGACMILPTGDAATIYYGEPSPDEVARMAHHLNVDAMMTIIKANADQVVSAAEELEEENDGTDYNND